MILSSKKGRLLNFSSPPGKFNYNEIENDEDVFNLLSGKENNAEIRRILKNLRAKIKPPQYLEVMRDSNIFNNQGEEDKKFKIPKSVIVSSRDSGSKFRQPHEF